VPDVLSPTAGWQARLALSFVRREARTVLAGREHRGPLQVQRAFYPESDGTCHCYVLHPPGGIVGGDELKIEVDLGAGSSALATTPAAGKFYRSAGASAKLVLHLRVNPGATLEWLPQESIVFDGARARLTTEIRLEHGARFIGWDIVCLGRRAAGEAFEHGRLAQRLQLWRGERPLLSESLSIEGGSAFQRAPWGLRGCSCTGTLVAAGADISVVAALRESTGARAAMARGVFGATALSGVVVCRYLGDSGDEARDLFFRAWEILRPATFGCGALAPRIWAT
jgi:urease accessory protein